MLVWQIKRKLSWGLLHMLLKYRGNIVKNLHIKLYCLTILTWLTWEINMRKRIHLSINRVSFCHYTYSLPFLHIIHYTHANFQNGNLFYSVTQRSLQIPFPVLSLTHPSLTHIWSKWSNKCQIKQLRASRKQHQQMRILLHETQYGWTPFLPNAFLWILCIFLRRYWVSTTISLV